MEKHYLEQEAERYIKEREDELKYPVKDYSQKKVTLYHGTSTKYLDDILKQGIKPRYDKESIWEDNPSRPDMVYLSSAYAVYFSQVASNRLGGKPVVFEVKVDTKRLYPDEDFLEQITRVDPEWKDTLSLGMEERTAWFKNNMLEYKISYSDSLGALGNACHKGIIKPKNIIRYSILDESKILDYSDPTITLMNYQILGGRYRKLSQKTMWEEPLSIKTRSKNVFSK